MAAMRNTLGQLTSSAMTTGLVMGISAAAVQAFFQVGPPVAYGICLLGHPRDLTNWLVNHIANTDLSVISTFAIYPTLLALGVLIGAFIAAYRNGEAQLKSGPVRKKFYAFMFGFLVVNFGLLWGSCPIRTGLLAAYGNIIAVMVLLSIVMGVVLACIYVRWRVKGAAK